MKSNQNNCSTKEVVESEGQEMNDLKKIHQKNNNHQLKDKISDFQHNLYNLVKKYYPSVIEDGEKLVEIVIDTTTDKIGQSLDIHVIVSKNNTEISHRLTIRD